MCMSQRQVCACYTRQGQFYKMSATRLLPYYFAYVAVVAPEGHEHSTKRLTGYQALASFPMQMALLVYNVVHVSCI